MLLYLPIIKVLPVFNGNTVTVDITRPNDDQQLSVNRAPTER